MIPRLTISDPDDARLLMDALDARFKVLLAEGDSHRTAAEKANEGSDGPNHLACIRSYLEMQQVGNLLTAVTAEYIRHM